MHEFSISDVKDRLVAAGGGYEIVHESPGTEVGVYMLVAPEPDRQQPHDVDEIYVVLEGRGTLDVEGTSRFRCRRGVPCSSRPAPSTSSRATSSSACS